MPTRAQDAWSKIALLAILDAAHRKGRRSVSNAIAQKLTFLTELQGREIQLKAAYYRFFRFNNGPYSKALANDITFLEEGGFIDPETRELSQRGYFLFRYVKPEIERSELGLQVLQLIDQVCVEWDKYRGWDLVKAVYQLTVPVDALNGERMLVDKIPMLTDIIIPERSDARDVQPFAPEIVDDIYSELSLSPERLDPDNPALWESVLANLDAAFSR